MDEGKKNGESTEKNGVQKKKKWGKKKYGV
jgi:hypothetical protein